MEDWERLKSWLVDFFQAEETDKKAAYLLLILELFLLIRHPEKILGELAKFEDYLQQHVAAESQLKKVDLSYLLAGVGYYIPGPPPPGYSPFKKHRIGEAMLSYFEALYGLNHHVRNENSPAKLYQDGPCKVRGYVDAFPEKFFEEYKLFNEDTQFSRMMLHGKNVHRMMFLVLCFYVEKLCMRYVNIKGLFSASVDGSVCHKSIGRVLYNLFMRVIPVLKTFRLWDILIDSTEDMYYEKSCARGYGRCEDDDPLRFMQDSNYNRWLKRYFSSPYWMNYNYSSRSPFVFNSLLLCFTGERYPLLNAMLLDSFWKAGYQIAYRFGTELAKIVPSFSFSTDEDLASLYVQAMLYLSLETWEAESTHSDFIGVLTKEMGKGSQIIQKEYVSLAPEVKFVFEERYRSWWQYVTRKAGVVG
jgi:hypothetical protein